MQSTFHRRPPQFKHVGAQTDECLFKISRSLRSRSFSARRRRFSSSNADGCDFAANARDPSAANCSRHFRSRFWPISSRRAASATLSPCRVTSATASTLNSLVNARRVDMNCAPARHITRCVARTQSVGYSILSDVQISHITGPQFRGAHSLIWSRLNEDMGESRNKLGSIDGLENPLPNSSHPT